jgi:NOL1/NOP2/fmu family ribosome biogenesis protein
LPGSDAREYVKERFGAKLEGDFYYNGDYWYCREPEERYETNGIRAVRDMDIGLKPTTYFLQLIEDKIEENRVDLSREELEALLTGDMIEFSDLEKGYVALFFEDRCIGCGFYMDELISSRVPEGRGEELLDTL